MRDLVKDGFRNFRNNRKNTMATPTTNPTNPIVTPTNNIKTELVALKDIVANPANNCRSVMDNDAVLELAQTMTENGQLQAVVGSKRKDGKYELIAGFRRFASATHLGWATIRMDIVTDITPMQARIDNLAENMARESLTTYDQAIAFNNLKKTDGLSGSEIARKVGKGVSYVNNLLRIVEGCEPVIMQRWKEEQSPSFGRDKDGKKMPTVHQVCTTDWLVKLVGSVPRAEQENHLKKALGLISDDNEGDKVEGEGGESRGRSDTTSVRRATMSNLNKALEHIQKLAKEDKNKENKNIYSAMVEALKYASGQKNEIKMGKVVYWNPDMVEEEEESK